MTTRILLCSFRRSSIFNIRHFRCNSCQLQKVEQKTNETNDGPIKYSTSKAAGWKAIYSTSGERYFTSPRIESTVVVFSLAAFLIYFCILREENDIDDWLRELETTIPIQVEEVQLRSEIQSGKQRGIDVSWQEKRLKELVQKREQIVSSSKT